MDFFKRKQKPIAVPIPEKVWIPEVPVNSFRVKVYESFDAGQTKVVWRWYGEQYQQRSQSSGAKNPIEWVKVYEPEYYDKEAPHAYHISVYSSEESAREAACLWLGAQTSFSYINQGECS